MAEGVGRTPVTGTSSLEEARAQQLRRKLEALSYTEPFDLNSLNLVDKLVDDLVHTTESYRALKLRNTSQGQEFEIWKSKVDVLNQDNARLLKENNALHLQLIKDAEVADVRDRKNYGTIKKLEEQVAELTFWKKQANDRYLRLEKENVEAKKRIEQLVDEMGAGGGGGPPSGTQDPEVRVLEASGVNHDTRARLDMTQTLPDSEGVPAAAPDTVRSMEKQRADLVRTADARTVSVEKELVDAKRQIANFSESLNNAQGMITAREEEIARISALLEGGRDVERLTLEYRNEANEKTVLSLSQQVDFLTSQIQTMEARDSNARELETAMVKMHQEREELHVQLQEALEDSGLVRQEVLDMKAEVMRQAEKHQLDGAAQTEEMHGALQQIEALQADLDALTRQRDEDLGQIAKLQADQAAATKRAANDAATMEEERAAAAAAVRMLEEDKQALSLDLQQQARAAQASSNDLETLAGKLKATEAKCAALSEDLAARSAALARVQGEVEGGESAVAELSRALEAATARADTADDHHTQAATKLASAEKEERRLQRLLEAAEGERADYERQVAELSEARVLLTHHLEATENERDSATTEVAALRRQLAAERGDGDAAASARDSLSLEAQKLKTQLDIVTKERDVVKEQLASSTARWREEASAAGQLQRDRDLLQSLQPKVEELQAQVHSLQSELAAEGGELAEARGEVVRVTALLAAAEAARDRVADEADAAQRDRLTISSNLQELHHSSSSLHITVATLGAEKEKAMKARDAAIDDARGLREDLQALEARAAAAEAAADRELRRVAALEHRLSGADEAAGAVQARISELEAALDAARLREEVATADVARLRREAEHVSAAREELSLEVELLRSEQATERKALQEVKANSAVSRQEVAEKGRDVEQLRALVCGLDHTREQLVGRLKHSMGQHKAAGQRCVELEGQVRAEQERFAEQAAEVARLRQVLQTLDAQRDQVQSEAEREADAARRAAEQLDLGREEAAEARRQLADTERRAARTAGALADAEAEVTRLRDELARVASAEALLKHECDTRADELRAVADDLANMTREQQVVNAELVQTAEERNGAREELKDTALRLYEAEQHVAAKQREVDDLVAAYQELGAENHRLADHTAQVERELQRLRADQSSAVDESASFAEQCRVLEVENRQYVLDLQAFERQVDALSLQLEQKEKNEGQSDSERTALLGQLGAAKQVSLELERSRESVMRELAAADANMHLVKARLDDAHLEKESLLHRLQLEQNHTQELEQLLAQLRSREMKTALTGQESDKRGEILSDRQRILEEQSTALLRQVSQLQAARDVQDREIQRLQLSQRSDQAHASRAAAAAAAQGPAQTELEARLARAEALTSQQVGTITQLEGERAALAQQLAAMEMRVAELSGEQTRLRQQEQHATQEKVAMEAQLAATRVAESQARGALEEAQAQLGRLEERAGPLAARAEEGHQRAAALGSELAATARAGGEGAAALQQAQRDLQAAKQDKERLLDLLSKVDAERTRLQKDNAALQAEVTELRSAMRRTSSSALGGTPVDGATPGMSEPASARQVSPESAEQIAALRAEVARSEAKRAAVEADFRELVAGMEAHQQAGGTPDQEHALAHGLLAQKLAALQEENARLKDNLAATENVCNEMRQELRRIRREYDTLAATLSQYTPPGSSASQPSRAASSHSSS